MSAWKSPLLYIGIALILVAGLALAAPPFIDWNSYRADIEDYGKKLTGRPVKIAGDVHVRLFPWPRMWLEDVRVANPAGAKLPELMRTGKVEIGLATAPLMSGKFVVETVNIDRPVFSFERLASGQGTWALEPSAGLNSEFDVSKISLSGIEITDGTVILADGRRGGAAKLENVDATVLAPSLEGPWKFVGLASYGDARTSIKISTGKYIRDSVLRFSVHLAPHEDSGLSYLFDGAVEADDVVRGRLKVRPAKASDGRADSELDLRPLAFNAQVTASFDTIDLQNIEIAPDDIADAGNLITGSAKIGLGSRIKIDTQLKAVKLDIDEMAGTRGRETLYNGKLLPTVSAIMAELPREIEARYSVAITSLVFGGETLDGFRAAGQVQQDTLKVEQLEVSMPGQTTGRLSGVFIADSETPQFGGDIDVESVSLRDFAVWAVPGYRGEIEQVWSGARGKLALKGKLDMTSSHLRLTGEQFTFDDSKGSGSVKITGGAAPGLAIQIKADSLNLDRYAPDGLTTGAVKSGAATGTIDLISAAMSQGELQLSVQADELQWRGVLARDVAIDTSANADGVELRTVEIGQVGNAKVNIAGLLKFPGSGISGVLNAKVKAQDPRGLLRLVGAIPRDLDAEPEWARALGSLDLSVTGDVTTDNGQTQGVLEVAGTAGLSNLNLQGRFEGEAAKWYEGEVRLSGAVKTDDVRAFSALAGLDLLGGENTPADVSFKANGALGKGMTATAEAQMLGTQAQFAGTIGIRNRKDPFATGRLAVLAGKAQDLYAAIGLGSGELGPAAQVLSAEGELEIAGGTIAYKNVNGTAAGAAFSGNGVAGFVDDNKPEIKISGEVGRLDLQWLVGLGLFALDGKKADTQTGFDLSREIPFATQIDVSARHTQVLAGIALTNSSVGISDNDGTMTLHLSGDIGAGQQAKGTLSLKRGAYDVKAWGEFSAALKLDDLLRTQSGGPALFGKADVKFSAIGAGRSPAGILSSLTGKGTYQLGKASLSGVNVSAFADGLRQLKDAKGLEKLVNSKLGSGDLDFAGGSGAITIDAGIMKFSSLPIAADGVRGPFRAIVDMPSGEVDLSALLELSVIEGLPPFEIAFAGPHRALQRSRDLEALKSFVGVNVLLKGMDKLEELQREQERISRQESAYEREQVLKDLEDAAQKRRREAEEARRKAEAARLQKEIEARRAAEARAGKLAEELERQKQIDAEKRKADELARQLAEEEARRAIEEAASRTRLEKHIRRAVRDANASETPTVLVPPEPQQKPDAPVESTLPGQNTGTGQAAETVPESALEPAPRKKHIDIDVDGR